MSGEHFPSATLTVTVCGREGAMAETVLQTILVQQGLREHGDPLVPVQGEVRGPFALVSESGWWELYHYGTRLHMSNLKNRRHALACMEALEAMTGVDWAFTQPEAFRASPASAQSRKLVVRFEHLEPQRQAPRYRVTMKPSPYARSCSSVFPWDTSLQCLAEVFSNRRGCALSSCRT